MRIIFEDSDDSVMRLIIESVYGADNEIIFANGSSKISRYVGDDTLIYYDLVPDNPSTALWYCRLDKLTKEYNNSIIIPVICSEYIILSAFCDNVLDIANIIDKGLYDSIIDKSKGITSVEKYYKYLLTNRDECMRIGTLDSRIFYHKSCPCGKYGCDKRYSVSDKSDDLVCRLPVFIPFKSKNNIEIVSAYSIKRSLENEYMRLVNIIADSCNWNHSKRFKASIV